MVVWGVVEEVWDFSGMDWNGWMGSFWVNYIDNNWFSSFFSLYMEGFFKDLVTHWVVRLAKIYRLWTRSPGDIFRIIEIGLCWLCRFFRI